MGLAVIDRFTYFLLNFFEGIQVGSRATMAQLFDSIRSGTALCLYSCCRLLSTCSTRASMPPLCIILVVAFCFACSASGKSPSAVPVAHMLGTGCRAELNHASAHGVVMLILDLALDVCLPVTDLFACSRA